MQAHHTSAFPLGRYLTTALVLVALALVSQTPPFGTPRAALRSGLVPLEEMAMTLEAGLARPAGYLGDVARLRAENAALQDRDAQLRADVARLQAAGRENDELRRALDFERSFGHRMLAAQVVGRGPDAFSRNLTVDRGTADGVRAGMIVVTGYGLVGRVREAATRAATIETVADPSMRVNAYTVATGLEGTVSGGPGPLRMEVLAKADTAATPGEWVLTSGIGGGYPRGVPVGQVLRVTGHASAVTELADLAWANDLRSITMVLVITDFTPR